MNVVFLSQSNSVISFQQQGEHVTCLTIYSEASVFLWNRKGSAKQFFENLQAQIKILGGTPVKSIQYHK
jgi:hypothetical protein